MKAGFCLPAWAWLFVLGLGIAGCSEKMRVEEPEGRPVGMVWIPAGKFEMGGPSAETCRKILQAVKPGQPGCPMLQDGFTDAQPIHAVEVQGFWMDETEVTNAQFRKFVESTGYVTVAERKPRPEDFPGVPPEALVAGALCFRSPWPGADPRDPRAWWEYVPGACWKHPSGPGSDLAGKDNHPVVQVAHEDAEAFAKWAGKRLPTEAEWERAARGGKEREIYPWGNEFRPAGRWMANTWQGRFPMEDLAEDGWKGLAPVGQFFPNAYGLYDMAGNVWEWCSDWYRPDTYEKNQTKGRIRNPRGPDDSSDPDEPGQKKRSHRGGSYLCSDQFCARYILGTRGKGEISTGTNHLGFRCVKDF